MDGTIIFTYSIQNSSRQRLREKDPGYVGISERKRVVGPMRRMQYIVRGAISLSSSLEQSEAWQIWLGADRRKAHSPCCLCPFMLPVFFRKRLEPIYLCAKYRTGMHVRLPCEQDRNEQEGYLNITFHSFARSAPRSPPIYSTSKLGIIVSGDVNMSITCSDC